MSYTNTLITVAPDCPVTSSEIPVSKRDNKPAHLLQYELLQERPYQLGHEDLIFEVFVRQKEIPLETLATDSGKIRKELFSKGHPCMRASALTKRYGFGAHYDKNGKIAIYPIESAAYQSLLENDNIKKVPAMKSKR